MADNHEFGGFTKKTFKVLKDLERNNTKEWFGEHRDTYDGQVFQPSLSFISGMGERLRSIAPNI